MTFKHKEIKPTFTWTEEWEKFPNRVKKYLLHPILWISFCGILILYKLLIHVFFDSSINFWKIYGLDVWRFLTKLVIIIVILFYGRRLYKIFLLKKKAVVDNLGIQNQKVKNIPEEVFSIIPKTIMWTIAIIFTIPQIVFFANTVHIYSGLEKAVRIVFSSLTFLYQFMFIWMLLIFGYFLIQFSNYFKSLSSSIKYNDIWLQPSKTDPSGGFKPMSNFIFNLSVKISIACVFLIINNIGILLVQNNEFSMITVLIKLYEIGAQSFYYFIFLNYALYILIPIVSFLMLFLRAEWRIHKALVLYQNRLIKIHSTNKAKIMKEYKNVSLKNTMLETNIQRSKIYRDLKRLELCNYILFDISNLSLWTFNYKDYWKVISTIIPAIITATQFMLDHFLV